MPAPQTTKHKSIILVENYQSKENTVNKTDAVMLSIGTAQWDISQQSISAKVFRKPNARWSAQSEEMPIHRVIDLAILVIASMLKVNNMGGLPSILDEKLENDNKLQSIKDYYNVNKTLHDPKLRELKRLLDILNP